MPGHTPPVGVSQHGHDAVGTAGSRLGVEAAETIMARYWLSQPAAIDAVRLKNEIPVGGTAKACGLLSAEMKNKGVSKDRGLVERGQRTGIKEEY